MNPRSVSGEYEHFSSKNSDPSDGPKTQNSNFLKNNDLD
jgi:hypothetical protein